MAFKTRSGNQYKHLATVWNVTPFHYKCLRLLDGAVLAFYLVSTKLGTLDFMYIRTVTV